MNKNDQNLIERTIIYLFLVVLAVSPTTLAQRLRGDDTARDVRTSEKDLRKEQMRQTASESFPELNNALTAILEKVSKNQQPQPETIEQGLQMLEKNKRHGWAYDNKQKAQFMLLQAWTGFYRDNPADAVRWSMRACKTNEASQDGWISQALFCMLNDKRPMKPREERFRPQSRRRPRRNGEETAHETNPKPFSETGVLKFDLMGLREKVFRQQFGRLEFQATDRSGIQFRPDEDTLCVLFWRDDVMPDDTVDGSEPATHEQDETAPSYDMMELGTEPSSYSAKTDLKAQREYFQMLMEACQDTAGIKFLQMNATRPRGNPEQFLSELPDYSDEPIPTVVVAEPNSGAEQFIGWRAEKPFMMIVGAEGKVKYAGTAADFVPAFILTELTGVEIDLEKQETAEAHQAVSPDMMDPEMMEMMLMDEMPVKPAKPTIDPNTPSDPNAPAQPKRPAPPRPKDASDFPTQSLEDQVRAEKLLQSAQIHVEESRKLRMKNPKQGIEDARKVLQEFPNTEYAQKARELLRRVPSKWKEKHNITDEELGY